VPTVPPLSLRGSRALLLDAAVIVVLTAVTLWHVWVAGDVPGPLWLRVILPLPLDLPLLWRRRAPLAALALVAGAVALQALVGSHGAEGLDLSGPVAVGVYSGARYLPLRRALAALGLLAAAIAVNAARDPEIGSAAQMWSDAFWSLAQLGLWLAGRFVRARSERSLLAHRAALLEREASEAAAEERSRIARELHDIVSHNLTVVVTQAAGARALAGSGSMPPESLERIEESGREALGEMRRLLGVLRNGDNEAALAPQPGVAQLPALAEALRRSGLAVELEIAADCRELAPALDLSVYRIVQEALTNVLKHAQTTHASVAVSRADRVLTVQVADDGVGGTPSAGGGHGLAGMRERAAVFGGRFFAGSRGERGFLVQVELPLAGA
jgi:signal transduction histidine kinase